MLTHQEDEAQAWNSGESGRQAGGQLAELVELEREEQTRFGGEFVGSLLESLENLRRILDARYARFFHEAILET